MLLESVPVQLLLQEGLTLDNSVYIHRLVEAFNRHCDLGVRATGFDATFYERPLFSSHAELVRLIRARKPLVLTRRFTGQPT